MLIWTTPTVKKIITQNLTSYSLLSNLKAAPHWSMCSRASPLQFVPALVSSACSAHRSRNQQCAGWCPACLQVRYGFLLTHPAAMTLSPACASLRPLQLLFLQLHSSLFISSVVFGWSLSQPSSPLSNLVLRSHFSDLVFLFVGWFVFRDCVSL